jgi:hypothetical protein
MSDAFLSCLPGQPEEHTQLLREAMASSSRLARSLVLRVGRKPPCADAGGGYLVRRAMGQ